VAQLRHAERDLSAGSIFTTNKPAQRVGEGRGFVQVGLWEMTTHIIETTMSGSGWAPTQRDTCSK
jgi:hypothetical protein